MNPKLIVYIVATVMVSVLLLMQFGGLIAAVVLAAKGLWLYAALSLLASLIGYVVLHTLKYIDELKGEDE